MASINNKETKAEKLNTNNKDKKVLMNSLVTYLVYIGLGIALFLVAFLLRKPWEQEDALVMLQILSDSFVIPGILLICFFLIQLCNSWGAFDGVIWTLKYALGALIPINALIKDRNFYDYKREKIANRKAVHLEGLIVGTIVLIVGLIFYLIYTSNMNSTL